MGNTMLLKTPVTLKTWYKKVPAKLATVGALMIVLAAPLQLVGTSFADSDPVLTDHGTSYASYSAQATDSTITINTTAALPEAAISIAAYNKNDSEVDSTYFSNQTLAAGDNKYTFHWTPLYAGTYRIEASVSAGPYSRNYLYDQSALQVTVADAPAGYIAPSPTGGYNGVQLTQQAPVLKTALAQTSYGCVQQYVIGSGSAPSGANYNYSFVSKRLSPTYDQSSFGFDYNYAVPYGQTVQISEVAKQAGDYFVDANGQKVGSVSYTLKTPDPSSTCQDAPPTLNGLHTTLGSYHVGDSVTDDLDSEVLTTFASSRPLTYSNVYIASDETVHGSVSVTDPNTHVISQQDIYKPKPVYGEASIVTLPNGDRALKYTAKSYSLVTNLQTAAYDDVHVTATDSYGKSADFAFNVVVAAPTDVATQNTQISALQVTRGPIPAQPAGQPAVAVDPILTTKATDANGTVNKAVDTTVTIHSDQAIAHPVVSIRVEYPEAYFAANFSNLDRPYASDTLYANKNDLNFASLSDKVDYVPAQAIAAGDNTFTVHWAPPVAGLYKVEASVFSSDQVKIYASNDDIGRITVSDTSSSTTTASTKNATTKKQTKNASKTSTTTPTPVASTPAPVSTPVTTPAVLALSTVTPTVSANQTATTAVTVNSPSALPASLVDVEIFDASGQRVNQTFFDNTNIAAGSNSFSVAWMPTKAGTYTIQTGLFTAGWQQNFAWNSNAGTATVK